MANQDADIRQQLLATFKVEAEEHIRAMSAGLSELEKGTEADRQAEIVETIFREAHSLKGAAWIVNLTDVQSGCQTIESVFAIWKRLSIVPEPALLALLHQAIGSLEQLLALPAEAQRVAEKARLDAVIEQIEQLALESANAHKASAPKTPVMPPAAVKNGHSLALGTNRSLMEEKAFLTQTVRISTAQLDGLFLQVEELVAAKLASAQRITEIREICALLTTWDREWAKLQAPLPIAQRVRATAIGENGQQEGDSQMTRLLPFVAWNQTLMESLGNRVATLLRAAERDHRALGGMVDHLRQDMQQVLMLPCSSLLEPFSRLARQLAQERGKGVDLIVRGGAIKVDRRILQEMKEPLIHLVRNCIDHGIETPDERVHKKKPPQGTMMIAIAEKDGKRLEIVITDDGAGIDANKVRAAATKLGLIAAETAASLAEQDVSALIFQSGLSTSPRITSISGRGIGLAIVQEKVEKLGGVISLETQPDVGTTFRLLLPLTLSTFRGILVRSHEHQFILPTTYVECVLRVSSAEIQTAENRETTSINGQLVALVRLGEALELARAQPAPEPADKVPLVVLSAAEKRIGFLVDEILDEQEVLMKSLGPQLVRVRNIAGAAVLGTGQVIPILNVPDLLKSAIKIAAKPAVTPPLAAEKVQPERQSILVVEDSITSRIQLKNILELGGYTVKTAVDGLDAYMMLKTEGFDLVVSDVDMPRMNGFDLTAKIRGDKKLADLPLVLVTGLDSRQDRERGMEVGADAYIVKTNFDQSNLLAVIRRLI